jgi:FMN phosphatase YigB (HAD superfamily)
LECAPEAIFFIDDNIINVDAARTCGFNAQVAKGPEEARRVLADHGLMKG